MHNKILGKIMHSIYIKNMQVKKFAEWWTKRYNGIGIIYSRTCVLDIEDSFKSRCWMSDRWHKNEITAMAIALSASLSTHHDGPIMRFVSEKTPNTNI